MPVDRRKVSPPESAKSGRVSVRGRFEFAGDLTPGKRRGGGLSQNLYANEGDLKGSGTFFPEDDEATTACPVPIFIGLDDANDQRRQLSKEQEELADLAALALSFLIERGVEKAKPYAKKFWDEKLSPASSRR